MFQKLSNALLTLYNFKSFNTSTIRAVKKLVKKKNKSYCLPVLLPMPSNTYLHWFYSISFFFLFNWDSLHARLNSHCKAWIYKKKKHKKIRAHKKSVQIEPTVKRCLLILDLKPLRSQVKGKHFIGREFQSLAVQGKKLFDMDILVTSRNGDKKIMQSIRITSRPPSRKKKKNQFSQL